jgi:hypothetical protein
MLSLAAVYPSRGGTSQGREILWLSTTAKILRVLPQDRLSVLAQGIQFRDEQDGYLY